MLKKEGDLRVFAPANGETSSREECVIWLRETLMTGLSLYECNARQLVQNVTPHSFRPGLAGDLRQAGMRRL